MLKKWRLNNKNKTGYQEDQENQKSNRFLRIEM